MVVEVAGEYEGREVQLKWEGRGMMSGDQEAAFAIIDVAADNLDRTIFLANGGRVRGDLLAHAAGFAWCAAKVLKNFRLLTPDEPHEGPDGVLQ